MARSIVIEEESGTYTARAHPHNGYYAGDFSSQPVAPMPWTELTVVCGRRPA